MKAKPQGVFGRAGWRAALSLTVALLPIMYEAAMVYYPFLYAVAAYAGGRLEAVLASTLADPFAVDSLAQSFLQGALSAALSLLVGYPVGFIVGLYSFRGSSLYRALIFLPFMLPSAVVVVGFEQAYLFTPLSTLSRGLSGILAVNTFYDAPLVALLVASSLERVNPELVYAARVSGASWRTIVVEILAPQTLSAAATGALLTFIYSYLGFLVPLSIGGPRYYTSEVEVYTLLKTLFQPARAVALALLQLFPMLAAAYVALRLRVAGFEFGRLGERRALYNLTGRRLLLLPPLLAFLVFELYPLIAIGASALLYPKPLYGLRQLAESSEAGNLFVPLNTVVLNSLVYAVLATGLTLAFSAVASHYAPRARGVYGLAAFAPIAFSPVTIGLSLYLAYYGAPILDMVWPLIVLAQASVALPLSMRFMVEGLSRIPLDAVRAARTLGAGPVETFFTVEAPLSTRALVSSTAVAFAASIGEFAATSVVYTPRFTTIPLAVYSLLNLRRLHAASALALILVLIALIVYYVLFRMGEQSGDTG